MSELTLYLTLMVLCFLLYSLSGYIKIVLVALRTPGPLAYPLIGNCMLANEKNCECELRCFRKLKRRTKNENITKVIKIRPKRKRRRAKNYVECSQILFIIY